VVVIQEWWGLVPHIEQVCERFAASGYVALAPDHYDGVSTTEPDEAGKLMMGMEVSDAAADIAGAADFLLSLDGVTSDSVGCVGFCMGGGLALLAPTAHPRIVATSAFYPAMPWPAYAPGWSLYRGKEAMIHKAASDEESSGPRIREYVDAIRAAGGMASTFDYSGSQHAFFNDHRPEVHNAVHSELAYERTLELFERRLGR
jgi:carboxymethylenebutenolidase